MNLVKKILKIYYLSIKEVNLVIDLKDYHNKQEDILN